jgi:hypothetical protein
MSNFNINLQYLFVRMLVLYNNKNWLINMHGMNTTIMQYLNHSNKGVNTYISMLDMYSFVPPPK